MRIEELAALELRKAGGDATAATAAMAARVRGDAELFRLLMGPLVYEACYRVVWSKARQLRNDDWGRTPQPSVERDKWRIEALARGTADILMNMRWPHTPRVFGDCTSADLEAPKTLYAKQAADMRGKYHYLRLAQAKLVDGKTVRQVWTEDKLQELKASAEKTYGRV